MFPIPGITHVLGAAQLVRSLDLLGRRDSRVTGRLCVAVGLGLLGLPLESGGLLAVVVELAGHVWRCGLCGPGDGRVLWWDHCRQPGTWPAADPAPAAARLAALARPGTA